MKQSQYNILHKMSSPSYCIAYNSFSNSLALLNEEEYETICEIESNAEISLNQEFEKKLREGNFIVDDNENELELVRERLLRARYSSNSLGLTIAPTMDCNFACTYCYEKGHRNRGRLDEITQSNIVKLVEDTSPTIRRLEVTWYGGEPLLCIDIVDSLSRAFKRICEKVNIDLNMSIITNGYLLTKDVAAHLQELGISFCQITVDGSKEQHNKRRIHIEGCDTYDTILDNACNASDYFQISIRVNTDKNNLDAIHHVKQQIERRGGENSFIYKKLINLEILVVKPFKPTDFPCTFPAPSTISIAMTMMSSLC